MVREETQTDHLNTMLSLPSNAGIGRGFVGAVRTAASIAGPPIMAIPPPLVPREATLLRRLERFRGLYGWPNILGVCLSFHDLHGQTGGCVIRYVAMHEPRSRIVGFEGDDNVAIFGKQDDITSRRVLLVQG